MSEDLSKIIVCFMFDGTPKYTEMTEKAIRSFQESTPNIKVGLILPPDVEFSAVSNFIDKLPNPASVETRYAKTHFNWNPTQYKLDLVQFSDRYETIFWLDSDTITYKDLTPFLLEFHRSSKKFAFAKDHVTNDPEFRNRWAGNKDRLFIAQACFMGFKSLGMREFFEEWETFWREWITPVPFVKFADPFPIFPGSAFCIEQYALGMAIEGLDLEADVFIIPRAQLLLRSSDPFAPLLSLSPHSSHSSYSSLSLSSAALSALSSLGALHLSSAGLLFSSYASSALTSYPSSYSTSYGSSFLTSYGSSFLTSYGSSFLSSYPSSFQTSYGSSFLTSYPSSFLSSYGSEFWSSYGSSHSSAYLSSALSSYFSSYPSSFGVSQLSSASSLGTSLGASGLSSYWASSTPQFGFRMVDTFNDQVLHYYSANYEVFK